ncbi:putative mitochondrial import inner membrane translocase subunit tim17 family protein [Phaeomoniella chlamydospora]|uniref:Mitochondrial import inner membrane translocase subunit TIM22 n=1 Tax=Phaeomoniella chlamydospora TaxID=158046 RepID=A0A0G2EPD4_PHACM|nr:putative mitochondrial import inner membrane translocase subunit tim17 family protein [Phaeomoniella chlamydospora]
MNFGHPGIPSLGGAPGAGGQNPNGMSESEMKAVKYIQAGMESCIAKSIMAGGMGFVLGGAFGLFMASMRYDTPLSSPINPANPNLPTGAVPGVGAAATQTISDLPLRQQLKIGLRDMGKSSFSSAKNFGTVGAIYSGTECCIEGLRAKNDLDNAGYAGFLTGAILARKTGVKGAGLAGAGFAAFSLGIEWYMRQPGDE